MNTTEFLMITSAICPDRPAIIFEGKKFTFSELSERVNRLANALVDLEIEKGERVAILQVNCSQYVEVYYAVAKIGAIFVPLNFRAKRDELVYMLNNSEASTLFVGERYVQLVNSMCPDLPLVRHYISIEGKQEGMLDYEELLASASDEELFTDIADEDITLLMYTAGTTGLPKGVPLSHNSFSLYVLENVNPADPEIEETNLLTMPLYHVAGAQAMLAATYGGRSLAMMRQFEVNEWLETAQREKANRAMLVPTMLKRVIDHPDLDKYDLSSLKVITYGAAPMPFEVIKKAIELFPGVNFINAFGQTETASTITTLGPDDHIIEGTEEEKEKKLRRLTSSIGRPMSDVEIKIIDDAGNDLPPGEVGEIVARGPRVMSGYWKDAEKTAKAITADGWLHTGDMGYMDEEGYFYLAARADDLIIRGGENISPDEVENVLYSHAAVEEAAVIGVPDPEWGQEPRAIVVLKEGKTATAEELIDFCRERLASFKRPRSVVFTDELPRTSTGKVLKRILREEYGAP
ncbi:MAG: long-chain-fatty-acid--CoA ligase [Dehalococcoidia bacterium]|nr:MAG: long-chain-fatty-acid--CoA ligase [Dehalococcoidia bacterium]